MAKRRKSSHRISRKRVKIRKRKGKTLHEKRKKIPRKSSTIRSNKKTRGKSKKVRSISPRKNRKRNIVPKRRKSTRRVQYRDKGGKFTTRRKWLRSNLPRTKRKFRLSKRIPRGVREGERFETPKFKYEYRQFSLPDFESSTILGIISGIKREPKPHPIAFFMHLEYRDKDGETGDLGTSFYKFREENAAEASGRCFEMAMQYEVDSITLIELLATYSILED